jgi:chromosome segregation ATPase
MISENPKVEATGNPDSVNPDTLDTETVNEGTGNNETTDNAARVLKFDETNAVTPAKDINYKITSLDTDLAQLRAELASINNSVEEGLDRLGDTDSDLTAKVSETYKRLGEIDNAYKALLQISSRIDNDIQRLNGDVSVVAEQSASGIKNLEQSTIAQSNDFAQKNQQVVSKVNQLVETSKLTSNMLNQNIQSTTEKMLQVEKSLIAQIESLSSSTKDKTEAIENTVDQNRAKILKLQSVDEAIIRRATTLEISSAELSVKSQHLDASVDQLQLTTESLSHGITQLRERTKELELLTANHGTLIGGLQKATADLTDRLTALAGIERKHFNIFTVGFVFLLVVTAVLYFMQQNQFDANVLRSAERNTVVDNQVASLQQIQSSVTAETKDSLATLENKIAQVSATIQDEIKKEIAQVDHTLKDVQDQVQSVEGRVNQASPFSQMGDDNIIHGAQWIAALPQQNFTVQLAYVDSKTALFEIAQRYNTYLKDSLSYFAVSDNGKTKYVLLSGNYATQQQANTAIQDMPRYIEMQQPVVRKLVTVQKYIAK